MYNTICKRNDVVRKADESECINERPILLENVLTAKKINKW